MLPASSKSMTVRVFSGPSQSTARSKSTSSCPLSSAHKGHPSHFFNTEPTARLSSNRDKISPERLAVPVSRKVLSGSNSGHPAEIKLVHPPKTPRVIKWSEESIIFLKSRQLSVGRGHRYSLSQEGRRTLCVTNEQVDVLFKHLKDIQARKIDAELVDTLNSVEGGVCLTRVEWLKYFNNLLMRTRHRLKDYNHEIDFSVLPYAVEKLAKRLGYVSQRGDKPLESGTPSATKLVNKKRVRLPSSEFIEKHKTEEVQQFQERVDPDVDDDSSCQIACKVELIEESDKDDFGTVLKQDSGNTESDEVEQEDRVSNKQVDLLLERFKTKFLTFNGQTIPYFNCDLSPDRVTALNLVDGGVSFTKTQWHRYFTNLIANVKENKVKSYADKKLLEHVNIAKNSTAVKVLSTEISSNVGRENERPTNVSTSASSAPNRVPVSATQMALIVDLMENNQKILGGSLSTKGRHIPSAVSSWSRCAWRLNRLPGPKLTPDMWRGVWLQTKSVVKSKMAASRRCVGAVPSHLRLSKLELRVANILKLQQKPQVKEDLKRAPNSARLRRSIRDNKQSTISRASEVRVCRACGTDVKLVHIFSPHDGRSIQRDMFQYCNILAKQNDGLPAWLCTSCLALLHGAVRFHDMCRATQTLMLCRDNRRPVKQKPLHKKCCDLPKGDGLSVQVKVENSPAESNTTGTEDFRIQKEKFEVEPEDHSHSADMEPELEEEWNANYIEEEPLQRGHDWWSVYASHVCEYCDRPLRSRMRYGQHLSGACVARLPRPPPPPPSPPPPRGTPKKWPRVLCHLCGELRASMTFKNHIAAMHSEDGDGFRYKCKSCPYRSRTRGHMVHHVKTVHLGLKPHMCALCGMKFSSTGNLKWHITKNHAAPVRLQCPQCDAILNGKRCLSRHILKVHESKPSECDVCGKTYKSRTHMMKHKRKVHNTKMTNFYPQLAKASCFRPENLTKKTDDRRLSEDLGLHGVS